MLSLHSTDAIPAVVTLSPAVLNSLRSTDANSGSTDAIPAVLNSFRNTEPTLYKVETQNFG